jgi:hypothetical protein
MALYCAVRPGAALGMAVSVDIAVKAIGVLLPALGIPPKLNTGVAAAGLLCCG